MELFPSEPLNRGVLILSLFTEYSYKPNYTTGAIAQPVISSLIVEDSFSDKSQPTKTIQINFKSISESNSYKPTNKEQVWPIKR